VPSGDLGKCGGRLASTSSPPVRQTSVGLPLTPGNTASSGRLRLFTPTPSPPPRRSKSAGAGAGGASSQAVLQAKSFLEYHSGVRPNLAAHGDVPCLTETSPESVDGGGAKPTAQTEPPRMPESIVLRGSLAPMPSRLPMPSQHLTCSGAPKRPPEAVTADDAARSNGPASAPAPPRSVPPADRLPGRPQTAGPPLERLPCRPVEVPVEVLHGAHARSVDTNHQSACVVEQERVRPVDLPDTARAPSGAPAPLAPPPRFLPLTAKSLEALEASEAHAALPWPLARAKDLPEGSRTDGMREPYTCRTPGRSMEDSCEAAPPRMRLTSNAVQALERGARQEDTDAWTRRLLDHNSRNARSPTADPRERKPTHKTHLEPPAASNHARSRRPEDSSTDALRVMSLRVPSLPRLGDQRSSQARIVVPEADEEGGPCVLTEGYRETDAESSPKNGFFMFMSASPPPLPPPLQLPHHHMQPPTQAMNVLPTSTAAEADGLWMVRTPASPSSGPKRATPRPVSPPIRYYVTTDGPVNGAGFDSDADLSFGEHSDDTGIQRGQRRRSSGGQRRCRDPGGKENKDVKPCTNSLARRSSRASAKEKSGRDGVPVPQQVSSREARCSAVITHGSASSGRACQSSRTSKDRRDLEAQLAKGGRSALEAACARAEEQELAMYQSAGPPTHSSKTSKRPPEEAPIRRAPTASSRPQESRKRPDTDHQSSNTTPSSTAAAVPLGTRTSKDKKESAPNAIGPAHSSRGQSRRTSQKPTDLPEASEPQPQRRQSAPREETVEQPLPPRSLAPSPVESALSDDRSESKMTSKRPSLDVAERVASSGSASPRKMSDDMSLRNSVPEKHVDKPSKLEESDSDEENEISPLVAAKPASKLESDSDEESAVSPPAMKPEVESDASSEEAEHSDVPTKSAELKEPAHALPRKPSHASDEGSESDDSETNLPLPAEQSKPQSAVDSDTEDESPKIVQNAGSRKASQASAVPSKHGSHVTESKDVQPQLTRQGAVVFGSEGNSDSDGSPKASVALPPPADSETEKPTEREASEKGSGASVEKPKPPPTPPRQDADASSVDHFLGSVEDSSSDEEEAKTSVQGGMAVEEEEGSDED